MSESIEMTLHIDGRKIGETLQRVVAEERANRSDLSRHAALQNHALRRHLAVALWLVESGDTDGARERIRRALGVDDG